MKHWVVWGVSFVLAASLTGCSGGGNSGEATGSAIALELETTGKSGTHYRLGPAKIDIAIFNHEGPPLLVVDATGAEDTLHVPVDPGAYTITLEPGWQLQTVAEDGSLTPIAATLITEPGPATEVGPFRVAKVNFGFHLGASGLDIGVSVNEGIPAGYDGVLTQLPDGRWTIEFASGGGSCCFSSPENASQSYPGYKFLTQ